MANQKKTMGTVNKSLRFKVQSSKLLVLHGWTYSTEKWGPFIKALKDQGFDATLLKIPGLTEKLEEVWDIDNYVEWLNEQVRASGAKKIGNGKVILIGHSNGGRMALAYTLKYPQKVKHLILIDSAGIYHNDLPIRLKRFVFKTVARWGRKVTNSQTLRKLLYRVSRESDYENASPVVKKTMVNLITYDLTNSLNRIKVPTLIIWGQNDKATPLSDGQLIHHLIEGSKMHVLTTARHSPQFTHVDEVISQIIKEIK